MKWQVFLLCCSCFSFAAENTMAEDYEMNSAVRECDRLAALDDDENSRATGVSLQDLDAEAALKTCGEALAVAPLDPETNLQLGRAYWKLGQFDNAKRYITASGMMVKNGLITRLDHDQKNHAVAQAQENTRETAGAVLVLGLFAMMLGGGSGGGDAGGYDDPCGINPNAAGCGGYQPQMSPSSQPTYTPPTPYYNGAIGVYTTDPNY